MSTYITWGIEPQESEGEGMKFKYCLIQYFASLADIRKNKKLLECKDCPFKSQCDKAETEEQE